MCLFNLEDDILATCFKKINILLLLLFKLNLGTTISFSRSSYGINEGSGPLQPVVILNNPMLCCTTSVTIRIDENTAKGTF